jgi:phospholipid/cholesterol/gamma-HCH transport system ATP-binding protein
MLTKVRVSSLSKGFVGTPVLHDIDLALPTGKSSVLIGPAASGKSVLMKSLVGLYPPDSGTIEIDGRDITRLRGRERAELIEIIGMLFQQGGLFDSLPVWENIAFKLINRQRLDRTTAREIAIEKLAMVNLPPDTADLYPNELSGGMQKRVGLARAIAGDPELLLLDEPTAGLDPISTNRINDMIRNAVDMLGATALSITSDMESARHRYDHLFMIHEGRMLWTGPNSDIDQAANPYLQQMINGRAEGPITMRLHARA